MLTEAPHVMKNNGFIRRESSFYAARYLAEACPGERFESASPFPSLASHQARQGAAHPLHVKPARGDISVFGVD